MSVVAVAESVSALVNEKYAGCVVGAVSYVPPAALLLKERNYPFTYAWRFDYGGVVGCPSTGSRGFNWKLFLTFGDGFVKVQVSHLLGVRELCGGDKQLEYADPCFLEELDAVLDRQVGVSEEFQRELDAAHWGYSGG